MNIAEPMKYHHNEEETTMKRIITFGEIMMRLNPEGYLRFVQAHKVGESAGRGEGDVVA